MKRGLLIGALAGALLTAGLVWVVTSGPTLEAPETAAPSKSDAPELATETAQSQGPGVTASPQGKLDLDALDDEQLQQLVTASGQNAIKQAIERAGPAVVQIDVAKTIEGGSPLDQLFQDDPFFRHFLDEPQGRQARSLGSGFFFSFEGNTYLLSNNHVTQDASSIQVTTERGWRFAAEVIGADAAMDVAVLKIDDFRGRSVPTVALGDSDALEIGDWVVAIGNPLGLTHSVTAGIVSALGRNIQNPNASSRFRSLIQTDAAINPGNSGGPLVDARGRVVGINTLIASDAEGLNFAINLNEVRRVLPALIREGRFTRAWLGVYIQELDDALARQFGVPGGEGVLIGDLAPGSPSQGVLRAGDVVTHVDGTSVGSVAALQDAIMFKDVGQSVALTVVRDGETIQLDVRLGERPGDDALAQQEEQSQPEVESEALGKFGLRVVPNTPELAERLGLNTRQGVLVAGIEPGSRAYWASPRPQQGDLVAEVNRQRIESVADWNALAEELADDARAVLTLVRGGRTLYVALP